MSAVLGRRYRVSLDPIGLSSTNLHLYNPSGAREALTSSSVIVFDADQGGRWTIQVRHPGSTGLGEYSIRVEDLGAY